MISAVFCAAETLSVEDCVFKSSEGGRHGCWRSFNYHSPEKCIVYSGIPTCATVINAYDWNNFLQGLSCFGPIPTSAPISQKSKDSKGSKVSVDPKGLKGSTDSKGWMGSVDSKGSSTINGVNSVKGKGKATIAPTMQREYFLRLDVTVCL